MSDVVLEVESRDVKNEKNKTLRRKGLVPAVIYGHGSVNRSIKMSQNIFLSKLQGHLASNIFIDLLIDGESNPPLTVFIKEVQRNPFSVHGLLHVDFMEIHAGEVMHLAVPVVLEGEAPGIAAGGLMEFHSRQVEIECLPRYVPKEIKVAISALNIGDAVHVGDLDLGENVKVLTARDVTIVSITERAKEEVPAPVAAEAAVAPEGAAPAAAAAPAKKE